MPISAADLGLPPDTLMNTQTDPQMYQDILSQARDIGGAGRGWMVNSGAPSPWGAISQYSGFNPWKYVPHPTVTPPYTDFPTNQQPGKAPPVRVPPPIQSSPPISSGGLFSPPSPGFSSPFQNPANAGWLRDIGYSGPSNPIGRKYDTQPGPMHIAGEYGLGLPPIQFKDDVPLDRQLFLAGSGGLREFGVPRGFRMI